MTPFILTINFRTPISAGRLPSLDALLAAEIAKEKGDDAIDNLHPSPTCTPCYQWSAIQFNNPKNHPIFQFTRATKLGAFIALPHALPHVKRTTVLTYIEF